MQLPKSPLVAATMLGGAMLVGCASGLPEPYPQGWLPSGVNIGPSCEGLAARYKDKASRQTSYQSAKHPEVTDVYLSGVLSLAIGIPPPRTHQEGGIVKLAVGANALLEYRFNEVGDSAEGKVPMSCLGGTQMSSESHGPAQGEALTAGHRTIKTQLSQDQRGDLVVYQSIEDCGAYFSVVPACEQTDDWFLFERVHE